MYAMYAMYAMYVMYVMYVMMNVCMYVCFFGIALGTRDYVSGRMHAHNKGPYRLVLNSEASSKIAW